MGIPVSDWIFIGVSGNCEHDNSLNDDVLFKRIPFRSNGVPDLLRVSRGVHQRAIQQLLGHASIVMTERYAHLAPTVLTEAIRVLEEVPNSHKWATGGQQQVSLTYVSRERQGNNHAYLPVK